MIVLPVLVMLLLVGELYSAHPQSKTYYALAPSGLNLRKEAKTNSEKLTINRQDTGELESILYGFRTEGFGHSVKISYSENESGLRISKVSIAD